MFDIDLFTRVSIQNLDVPAGYNRYTACDAELRELGEWLLFLDKQTRNLQGQSRPWSKPIASWFPSNTVTTSSVGDREVFEAAEPVVNGIQWRAGYRIRQNRDAGDVTETNEVLLNEVLLYVPYNHLRAPQAALVLFTGNAAFAKEIIECYIAMVYFINEIKHRSNVVYAALNKTPIKDLVHQKPMWCEMQTNSWFFNLPIRRKGLFRITSTGYSWKLEHPIFPHGYIEITSLKYDQQLENFGYRFI